jgi:Arc/MetJ-type ribon-helix-helix transcriptional regulator
MAKDMVPVRLPPQAVEMLDELTKLGLFGDARAEVARNLILDQLKRLAEGGLVSVKRTD